MKLRRVQLTRRGIIRFVPFRKRKGRINVSAYPYLPLFTRDFLADTMHLSAQETGAYLLLLMVAWQMPECRLPDNDRKLAQWARVDAKTWRSIKREVLAFWTLRDGHWHQRRLTKERTHVGQVVEKRKAAAQKRWGSQRNANGYANACPDGMHPHPHPKEDSKRDTRKGIPVPIVRGGDGRVAAATANPMDAWGAGE